MVGSSDEASPLVELLRLDEMYKLRSFCVFDRHSVGCYEPTLPLPSCEKDKAIFLAAVNWANLNMNLFFMTPFGLSI
jgi:hypothetical protein